MILNRIKDILKANINSHLDSLKENDFDLWKTMFDEDEKDQDFYQEYKFEEEAKEWENKDYSYYSNSQSNEQKKEAEYYADLEVKPGATFKEIKSSYRRLVKMYHPDLFQHDDKKKEMADKVTRKINEAYNYFEKKFSK